MKLFFYDLETTGVNPGRNGIHQISEMNICTRYITKNGELSKKATYICFDEKIEIIK